MSKSAKFGRSLPPPPPAPRFKAGQLVKIVSRSCAHLRGRVATISGDNRGGSHAPRFLFGEWVYYVAGLSWAEDELEAVE